LDEYTGKSLPLDSIYLDTHFLTYGKSFEVDTDKYPDIATLAKNIHDAKKKLNVLLPTGITATTADQNKYYKYCTENQCFVMSNVTSKDVFNKHITAKTMWAMNTVFPDFQHDKA